MKYRIGLFCIAASLLLPPPASISAAIPITHVIHISIDGLRGDAVPFLGPTNLPNFYRLRNEGTFTDNARTDFDYTETLPNHTTQVTGRGVTGATGHAWTQNVDPPAGATLASNRGFYIDGVFGVAHDNDLRTGEFVGKSKLSLFANSWNETNGAPDITGVDNGRNKVDYYLYLPSPGDSKPLVGALITNMSVNPFNYVFVHLADPDVVGHANGWYLTNNSPYCNVIKKMDSRIGEILDMVNTNSALKDSTAIVLTADHGGMEDPKTHVPASDPRNYTIPFYIWGPGVMPGSDLYDLNPTSRLNPGTSRPAYTSPVQPVRNGEAANVSLTLLGLGPVPGSTINNMQNLAWTVPAPELAIVNQAGSLKARFVLLSNAKHDLEASDNPANPSWTCINSNIVGALGSVAEVDLGILSQPARFYRLRAHF
jgi:hypothetical protein